MEFANIFCCLQLVDTAFECLKKFIVGREIELNNVKGMIQRVISTLMPSPNLTKEQFQVHFQDPRTAQRTINVVNRLYYMAQLFPTIFNDKVRAQRK